MESQTAKRIKPEWPKHPNGKPKRMGEMTRAEQDAQLGPLTAELAEEMNGPNSPFLALLKGGI